MKLPVYFVRMPPGAESTGRARGHGGECPAALKVEKQAKTELFRNVSTLQR